MAYTWEYHNYESKSWKNDVFFCDIAIMWSDDSLLFGASSLAKNQW